MRSFLALVLAVIPAAFGCGDDIKLPDPIPPPDPALNAIVPANGFTSRTIRVQISGDGTAFSDDLDVVFGTGITTDSVELASPSDLFATITIAADAALGLRDVIVTDGDATLTLAEAFDVQSPIDVFTVGEFLQGSGFSQILIVNRDFANPFLGIQEVTAGAGVTIEIDLDISTENRLFGTVFMDTDAVTGRVTVSDTLGTDTIVSQGADLVITARPPVQLQTGGKTNGDKFATATLTGLSALFSFVGNSALNDVEVDSTVVGANPIFIWLEGGKWANNRGNFFVDLIPTSANETAFLLVIDGGTVGGYAFDLDVYDAGTSTNCLNFVVNDGTCGIPLPSVSALAEVEPNGDIATASIGVGNTILYSGTLPIAADRDFIKVTIPAGQTKTIRVVTTPGSPGGLADTAVRILNSTGVQLATQDLDNGTPFAFNEDLTSIPLTAGDFFIEVRAIFGFFGDGGGDYEVAILLEDLPS